MGQGRHDQPRRNPPAVRSKKLSPSIFPTHAAPAPRAYLAPAEAGGRSMTTTFYLVRPPRMTGSAASCAGGCPGAPRVRGPGAGRGAGGAPRRRGAGGGLRLAAGAGAGDRRRRSRSGGAAARHPGGPGRDRCRGLVRPGLRRAARRPGLERLEPGRHVTRPPGGETALEAQVRLLRGLEELRDRHGEARLALVSHADVIKLAIAHALGLGADGLQRFEIGPASVSVLVIGAWGAKVESLNERAFLGTHA